jgi:hypothetical protein
MATVANSAGEKNLVKQNEKRTHLTPTGLLMEGVYASMRFYFVKIGSMNVMIL